MIEKLTRKCRATLTPEDEAIIFAKHDWALFFYMPIMWAGDRRDAEIMYMLSDATHDRKWREDKINYSGCLYNKFGESPKESLNKLYGKLAGGHPLSDEAEAESRSNFEKMIAKMRLNSEY